MFVWRMLTNDIIGADFYNVVQMMKDRLRCNAVPIQLPIGAEDTFRGIIDLVEMKAYVYYDDMGKDIREEEIPEELKEEAEMYRMALVEAVAETDEELMMKYLDGEELTIEEIKMGIRKATISVSMIPVCCGTSYRNKGVQKLLDAIVDYMPHQPTFLLLKAFFPIQKKKQKGIQAMMSLSRPWRLKLLPTPLLESFVSSGFIPAP